ncbi:MAG: signal recognition particle-docking protein FtsY [Anaerolineales bacterium]|nr:signal recognition particle-docking protein FtsY [Anaerolineales bacterium]MCB9128931.1 signal recognition particle-docking protein FtsY [Ardenticatenales bacterium]
MIFGRAKSIADSLRKTRESAFGQIGALLGPSDIDEAFWEELETLLIQADVGVKTTVHLIEWLQERVDEEGLHRTEQVRELLKGRMVEILSASETDYLSGRRLLSVVLVAGVNGSGKTTSIGKLAHWHKEKGQKVILAAADTFRAAAIDQLKLWSQRAGVDIIAQAPGSDPGAVTYDAIQAAFGRREASVVIIDTAGRLQTQFNLMAELSKIQRVAAQNVHEAPHETLLTLDATSGSNALSQAKHFAKSAPLTGVILTKLDGAAKGGMALAVAHEHGLPIKWIGTGERMEDLQPFNAREYVEALFDNGAATTEAVR